MGSISRVCDVSINTVSKLLEDAGEACAAFHDEHVRGVKATRVQVDEIWSFTAAKQKNVAAMKKPIEGAGDTWTWTALEADTKLIVSYSVGGRDSDCAKRFMDDVASRLANRVQLTSDGHKAYLDAVERAFGADVDYAQLVKLYGLLPIALKAATARPNALASRRRRRRQARSETHFDFVCGAPKSQHAHGNAAVHATNKRFFQEVENHVHALALYFVHYNWMRIHKTLRVTPAMAAGLTDKLMGWEDIIAIMDAKEKGELAQKRAAMLHELPYSN